MARPGLRTSVDLLFKRRFGGVSQGSPGKISFVLIIIPLVIQWKRRGGASATTLATPLASTLHGLGRFPARRSGGRQIGIWSGGRSLARLYYIFQQIYVKTQDPGAPEKKWPPDKNLARPPVGQIFIRVFFFPGAWGPAFLSIFF